MRRPLSLLAATTAALVLAAAPAVAHGSKDPSPPPSRTLASGLVSPLSLAAGPHGTTFLSQNFAGLLTAVGKDGSTSVVHASDGAEVGAVSYRGGTVTFAETGEQTVLKKIAVSPKGTPRGTARTVADLGGFEATKNPDGATTYGFRDLPASCADLFPPDFPAAYTGLVDSHPYASVSHGSTTYVADAGGNTIVSVDARGTVRTVAVLPPQPVTVTAEVAEAQGLPTCVDGYEYWFEPVPTDVEVGPRGQLFVSLLPGGPEDASLGARGSVVTVSPSSGKVSTVATGLLSPTGLAVDGHGMVYVAQMFGGEITMVGHHHRMTLVSVPLPGDLELSRSGLLATVNVLPGEDTPPDGQLVRYSLKGHGHHHHH
ncbi:hypothetical protein ATJ88_3540 [Isoptericola jiangsuensis]|uniref:ScyD/ScyE family protein n=1 Tax=Isoptericola jiangsuensis TaxID=548579 RepID=A0A2A9F1C3_9MICO|nr:ScyD/ScyE family protein [Isoptericola jiangsuensis]PFG44803.1 hypothetical protein ATJ88_3540 [Isoptericola jiangsuensis]